MLRRYVVVGIKFNRFCGYQDFYSDIATLNKCVTLYDTYSSMP